MMFRIILGGVIVIGAALGYLMAAGPSIVLGSIKDDYVAAVEAGGIDMTKCKARQKTVFDPSGGMQQCVQEVFTGIQDQISEIERSEPSEEAPSYDAPAEAPSYDESVEEPSSE